MRWPLTYWRWLFAPKPSPFQPPAGLNAEVARGAYFVEGLGHCGECHTPRAITMLSLALSRMISMVSIVCTASFCTVAITKSVRERP